MSLGTLTVLGRLGHHLTSGRTARLAVQLCIGACLLVPSASRAAGPGQALVIGNGAYANLPAISGCVLSGHAVTAVLRERGFSVVERTDASSGAVDAALSEFARQLATAPGAPVVIYVCLYASSLNNRSFLLPVGASLKRPTDVLTQGVLAKVLVDSAAAVGGRPAVVIFDAVPLPGASSALAFDSLTQEAMPAGLGLLAVSEASAGGAPTPLAASLVSLLKAPQVQTAMLLAGIQRELQGLRTASVVALRSPDASAFLAGEPPPPPAAPATPPAPGTVAAVPPPPAPLPEESRMTDADRRLVQTALARLGYYSGTVDGVFGPETRAAIRRYQHELRATMTGQLTIDQLSRLQSGG
jgi:hypothetical protein